MLFNKLKSKANRISVDQAIGYQASIPAIDFFDFAFVDVARLTLNVESHFPTPVFSEIFPC